MHAESKQFTCDECGKSYTQRKILKIHKRVHECDKICYSAKSFKAHLRSHRREDENDGKLDFDGQKCGDGLAVFSFDNIALKQLEIKLRRVEMVVALGERHRSDSGPGSGPHRSRRAVEGCCHL
ncbi:hypothetical protein WMY93_002785 [Mugilogobius chulae]|uniref:C2H2-type domain-containing protein n=1 Tax=Mugilogobius chulae TaxID=88201 RepID=A0AAW0PXJ5_9GOBI